MVEKRTMQVAMIHEMWENMSIPPDLTLTFDDGLYTQYMHGRNLPNKKIFFISTNIICKGPQSSEFIHCADAHKKAFSGNKENYMTVSQIRELHDAGCEIGGHSHFHQNLRELRSMVDQVDHMKMDTDLMMEWFDEKLGFTPTSFCFPYNDDVQGLYPAVLKRYGFVNFYGDERTNIDEILA